MELAASTPFVGFFNAAYLTYNFLLPSLLEATSMKVTAFTFGMLSLKVL